jgi:hypothetical protein
MIWNVSRRARNGGAKETFLVDAFCSDWFLWIPIEDDVYRARVWSKDSDLHVITDLVWA